MPSNLYRRGQTYYGRYSINGELQRVSLRTSDIREARARLKAIRKKAEDQAFGIEGAATWDDAVAAYSTGILDAGSVKEGTAKRYLVSLRQLHEHFAGRPLPQITVTDIGSYVAARQTDKATNATIKRDLTTASRVMAFARSKGMINNNPVDGYDRRFVHERPALIEAPDDANVEAAIAAMEASGEPVLAAMLRFLRGTGVRTGEALRARWSDMKGTTLQILHTKSTPRAIDVDPSALPSPRRPAGMMFAGLPATAGDLAGYWQWRRRELPDGQRFRLHDLRHAFAIAKLREGWDLYDLAQHLGHSSVKVTERYLGYVPKQRSSRSRVAQKVTQPHVLVTHKTADAIDET